MEFNLSAQLQYYLHINNMSVNQLADLTGISQGYLSDLVKGKKTNLSIEKVDLIVQVFEIPLSEFFIPHDVLKQSEILVERIGRLPESKRNLIENMIYEFEKN